MQTSGIPLCSVREIPPLLGSLEPEQHLSRHGFPARQGKSRDKATKNHFVHYFFHFHGKPFKSIC
jgi:hypothetical protein